MSRRDALRSAGFGALALSQARLFAACSSGGGPASQELEFAYDPDMPWWMQGPFTPELEEHESLRLEVVGKIPPELEGTYVRNGPNPTRERDHWFRGHGMLHGVRLEGGSARWYRNRWVQTPLLGAGPDEMFSPVQRPDANPSNVSLVHHAGKLLSLGEAGLPYEISAADLSTIGPYDFAGQLKTFMTAHPKLDPRTGDMHMFGYGLIANPYLTYHRVNAAGELVQSEPITLPRAVMMHDFQITQSKVVFMDLPVVFDLPLAAAGAFPFHWDASNGARLGLMPHGGGNADVAWFEIEPCYIFHTFNAYDDAAGKVVLEVCRFPHLWREESTNFDADALLYRYTLDPAAKSVAVEQLDDRVLDFPRIDPRRVGADYRYGYALSFDTLDHTKPRRARMAKYDRQRNSFVIHEFPPYLAAAEALFVPAAPDAGEDEGFLLSFFLDARTQRGSLEIFDARDLSAPALASVKLPWRVPLGAHGTWVPG